MQCPIDKSIRSKNVPPSTEVPMHDKTPDRKALKGNVPTIAIYTTCKTEPTSKNLLFDNLIFDLGQEYYGAPGVL